MSIRQAIRAGLRPVVGRLRDWFEPAKSPPEFRWQAIAAGPSAGCQLKLPTPSVLTDRILAGKFEPVESLVVEKLVGASDVCIDIGGHYGHYTMLLSSLASEGHVHTFEPVGQHANRLTEAAKRSGRDNITVRQVAIADRVGEMRLGYADDSGDDSMAYLTDCGGVDADIARHHYESFAETTVQTTTLNAFAGEVSQLDPIRFIKMDAEGAEAAIIAGGHELLRNQQPRILMEIHGVQEALQCADQMWQLGYQAILLSTAKSTHPILWTPVQDAVAEQAVAKVLGQSPIVLTGKDLAFPSFIGDERDGN